MEQVIKFRVWNKGTQSMYNVYGFNQRQIQWCNEDGSLGGSFSYGQNNKNKFILMQFTGLLDKQGKEIYCGDILGGYPHGSVAVKWDNKYACFSCYDLEDGKDYGLFANELDNCKDAWEIIGNIHQNSK